MKYRYDIDQNTDEWLEIRLGKFTASPAADLLMDKKNEGYKKLIDKIVEEKITEKQTESRTFGGNQFTERGHEYEPIAREDYELRHFKHVMIIGVVELNDWCLCSPDGLIDDNGMWQGKCPIFKTQKSYLKKYHLLKDTLSDNEILYKLSSSYYKQMQFELFVTGREYNVFTSYHPNLPAIDLKITRDDVVINEIEKRLNEAISEVKEEIKLIESYKK